MAVVAKLLGAILAANSLTAVSSQSKDEYDHVIVGLGPGGGSLAATLTVSRHSVFLIEAGGDKPEDPLQILPILLVPSYGHVGSAPE
ncbi:uncharacterized protein J7T54_001508 [Emericellopsis cladophorae]|uniref:Glucose-methanol-choline oxidoreductase N-terminal domain-containing protein n=1 Tax=Emericellopsis cladophorae TaxID=2686198 RepID=A0A9P9Y1U6_9HYPO|nr:uncharacterized protein J7T54_001508 [Emericellopsis cladophorae]KAI6781545.1 hypothetical protein J7T54_001508 [Emericellopsis cladophorae]